MVMKLIPCSFLLIFSLGAAAYADTQSTAAREGPAPTRPAAPSVRVAVVNYEKAYRGYNAAQEGEKLLGTKIADLRSAIERKTKTRQILLEKLQTAQNTFVRAKEGKDDAGLKAASKELEELPGLLRDVDAELQAMGTSPELNSALQTHRDKIAQELHRALQVVAKAKGYSIVFDVSTQTTFQAPVVCVVEGFGPEDLTESLILELNRPVPPPAGATPAAEAPAAPATAPGADAAKRKA